MSGLEKNDGVTDSERLLCRLCEATFLSLWSYPNIFKDQFSHRSASHGKEICDLLVVCGDDVIIFSDKRCAYGSSDDANRDWSRWYKRAIKKSHDQLRGALRWLRQYPHRVFLDAGCKQPLPIGLPTGDTARYHLVVVASGAKTACQTSMNGSGSLCIAPSVNTAERPFFVGDIGGDSEYVHVLDEVTIQTLLNELDTVSDFVGYLNAKETLLRSGKVEAVYGEENLLSLYVNSTIDGEHGFADPDTRVYVQDGLWKEHFNSERAQAKRAADQISYAWDELIEHYVRHFNAGTLLNDNSPEYADFETGIRIMAKESRMNRRMIASTSLPCDQFWCGSRSVGE